MITFEESIRLVAGLAKPLPAETVPLDEADGQVLATPVIAPRNAPAFAVSAMDGYAVCDEDLRVLPACLAVSGKSFAGGGAPAPLAPGTCLRVFTGAATPPRADRVVIQEEVAIEGTSALFRQPLGSIRHIRAAGSDFAQGDVLVPAGAIVTPQNLVAIGAADTAEVSVIRRPRVFILANGDELAPPGSAGSAPNRIPDSLTAALTALIRRWHGNVIGKRICGDDLAELKRTASDAVAGADIVVVTGGASVGEKDFAKQTFADTGLELVFSKAAIRPGKPIWLGTVGTTIVLGLPGNPTSGLVTARLYLAALLSGLAGFDPTAAWTWQTMRLAAPLDANNDRHAFLRGTVGGDGITPIFDQASGAQAALASATHLIERAPGAPAAVAGSEVSVLAL